MAPALTESLPVISSPADGRLNVDLAGKLNRNETGSDTHSINDTNLAGPLWLRAEIGKLYAKGEVHTGPFSKPLLRMGGFDKLALPTGGEKLKILDVCCGSGVTTEKLHELLKEQGIDVGERVDLTCGDLSEGQLAYLDERITLMGWKGTKTQQMNIEVCVPTPYSSLEMLIWIAIENGTTR